MTIHPCGGMLTELRQPIGAGRSPFSAGICTEVAAGRPRVCRDPPAFLDWPGEEIGHRSRRTDNNRIPARSPVPRVLHRGRRLRPPPSRSGELGSSRPWLYPPFPTLGPVPLCLLACVSTAHQADLHPAAVGSGVTAGPDYPPRAPACSCLPAPAWPRCPARTAARGCGHACPSRSGPLPPASRLSGSPPLGGRGAGGSVHVARRSVGR